MFLLVNRLATPSSFCHLYYYKRESLEKQQHTFRRYFDLDVLSDCYVTNTKDYLLNP